MTVKYRYPLTRDVWCPACQHFKSVKVCRVQRYEACHGCGVLSDDRDRYGSRLFRVVESSSYPGPLFTPEFIVVLGKGAGKRKQNNSSETDSEVLSRAYKRLAGKRRKHVKRRRKR